MLNCTTLSVKYEGKHIEIYGRKAKNLRGKYITYDSVVAEKFSLQLF